MSKLQLSVALARNPMTQPILSGRVQPEGIDCVCSSIHPSEMFWRQLKFGDFDVSEMSLSSLAIAASKGIREWVALPVFTTRRFFHTRIVVRADSGIDVPADLVGKRVGVPEYQQTAAVWSRGALLHEFGVHPSQIEWFMERPPEMSHGGSTAFAPPSDVSLQYVSTDTNLGELLSAGELDAALVYIVDNNLVDRTRRQAPDVGIRTLFADPVAEGTRYYKATGILPVNHTVVVRASLLERHPWLALNLFSAFVAAKDLAHQEANEYVNAWNDLGLLSPDTAAGLRASDPRPYGLSAQDGVLDTLGQYLFEQGLTAEPFPLTELMAPATRDL